MLSLEHRVAEQLILACTIRRSNSSSRLAYSDRGSYCRPCLVTCATPYNAVMRHVRQSVESSVDFKTRLLSPTYAHRMRLAAKQSIQSFTISHCAPLPTLPSSPPGSWHLPLGLTRRSSWQDPERIRPKLSLQVKLAVFACAFLWLLHTQVDSLRCQAGS